LKERKRTIYTLGPVLEHAKSIFQQKLSPFQNLFIDESIVSFKGGLAFRQVIPSEIHHFSTKLFVLCEVESDYIINFIVYCGRGTEVSDIFNLGQSGSVVTMLLGPYMDKGHNMGKQLVQ
jgi:hypothetical protein